MKHMTEIPAVTLFVRTDGFTAIDPALPEERLIRTAEAVGSLPRGTVFVEFNGRFAVADGIGGFRTGAPDGAYSGRSAALPAYTITGPDLPALIPGGVTLDSQSDADRYGCDFVAVDTNGHLFSWEDDWDIAFGSFQWRPVGQAEQLSPVFPITAWRDWYPRYADTVS